MTKKTEYPLRARTVTVVLSVEEAKQLRWLVRRTDVGTSNDSITAVCKLQAAIERADRRIKHWEEKP